MKKKSSDYAAAKRTGAKRKRDEQLPVSLPTLECRALQVEAIQIQVTLPMIYKL
jgi:hypothetical protein